MGRLRKRRSREESCSVQAVAVGNVRISGNRAECFSKFVPLKVVRLGICLLAFVSPVCGGGCPWGHEPPGQFCTPLLGPVASEKVSARRAERRHSHHQRNQRIRARPCLATESEVSKEEVTHGPQKDLLLMLCKALPLPLQRLFFRSPQGFVFC